MKYETHKRTKNLTLRDIHVGDWVQVWSEETERYSPPLKITQICDDGTVYLIIGEENRLDPWEENIKDIDALPITPELLRGFGFEIEVNKYYDDKISYNGKTFAYLSLIDKDTCEYRINFYIYMHQFIAYVEDYFNVKIEWKGIEK